MIISPHHFPTKELNTGKNRLRWFLWLGLVAAGLVACSRVTTLPTAKQEFPLESQTAPISTPAPTTTIESPEQPGETQGPVNTPASPLTGYVTIWHSWNTENTNLLLQIVHSFQAAYPDVTFDLLALPESELLSRYEAAAYQGRGPAILLGSSDWGAYLFDKQLVDDLSPFVSEDFREAISSPALGTCSYRNAIFGIPYAQRGVLLYRNKAIITKSPETFDELLAYSAEATQGGVLGAYLERGSYFSLAHLVGLGGQLMDEAGNPIFDQDHYQAALDWLTLLDQFEQAGGTEINGNQHILTFKDGRVGFIIDGSWRMDELRQAVGDENLSIDPWPGVGQGKLAGFVQAEVMFVNPAVRENSPQDYLAALSFMGYMLTPQIQAQLAEAGFIPTRPDAPVNSALVKQAVLAFEDGIPYPPIMQDRIRSAYFDTIDSTLVDVFERGIEPNHALRTAFDAIQQRMVEIRNPTP